MTDRHDELIEWAHNHAAGFSRLGDGRNYFAEVEEELRALRRQLEKRVPHGLMKAMSEKIDKAIQEAIDQRMLGSEITEEAKQE